MPLAFDPENADCGVNVECVSAGERSLLAETVIDGGIKEGEFLQTSHAPKMLHGTLCSSKWEVRVLNAVIEPPARLLLFRRTKISKRGTV